MLNNIYLICGKSGSGKTTVVEKLEQDYGYHVLKSHTTRNPRHPNDTDHIYSEISDYMTAKENNTIVTSTVFDRNYYWATREQLDYCDLYVIDKDGIESLQEKYDGSRQLVVIYIDVDPEECIKRMKKRGDKDADIWERLKHDTEAFIGIEEPSDFIVDGNKKDTWKIVANIIEQCEEINKRGDDI